MLFHPTLQYLLRINQKFWDTSNTWRVEENPNIHKYNFLENNEASLHTNLQTVCQTVDLFVCWQRRIKHLFRCYELIKCYTRFMKRYEICASEQEFNPIGSAKSVTEIFIQTEDNVYFNSFGNSLTNSPWKICCFISCKFDWSSIMAHK